MIAVIKYWEKLPLLIRRVILLVIVIPCLTYYLYWEFDILDAGASVVIVWMVWKFTDTWEFSLLMTGLTVLGAGYIINKYGLFGFEMEVPTTMPVPAPSSASVEI